jgi:hypothetical protein
LLDRVFHHRHATADGILNELELLDDEDVDLAMRALTVLFGCPQDILAALPGFLDDAMLGNQGIGAIACDLDDPGALILGFADDPLALLDDPLGLLDLIRHGHPELIDKRQELLFLHHHAPAEGNTFADAHQLLEPVDQVEYVCAAVLLYLWCSALRHGPSPEAGAMPNFPVGRINEISRLFRLIPQNRVSWCQSGCR